MTAPWGPLSIGRLVLQEPFELTAKGGDTRTITLAGQESLNPGVNPTQAQLKSRGEALLAYSGATVPVAFSAFPERNGWYQVSNVSTDETNWYEITVVEWQFDLVRFGGDAEVELESRLIGGNRTHSTSATAELWHAPAIGADSYFVGTGTPGYVDRVGVDGSVRVYRSLPAGTNPRWGVPAASYLAGAASVTVNGLICTGVTNSDTPAAWTLSNSLLKVEPRTSTGTLVLTSYLTSGWGTSKVFDLKRGTTSLGPAQHLTVLRNDPCEVVIRLTWDHAPGRTTADLSLKRGARHVGIHLQQYAAAAALRVDDNAGGGTVNNQLSAAGYIASTTSDADGNRWVIGTALASAGAGTFGLAASVAATSLPAYIGCVRGGASPASGDAAADVNAQYLGTPTETERTIRR